MSEPPEKIVPADPHSSEDGSLESELGSLWEAMAEAPEISPRRELRSERFTIGRQLGAGGMGVVFEALDTATDTVVALKTLRRLDAETLLRFKAEFRLLQGIHHGNLVHLGELLEEDGQWFFTMEFIDGQDLLAYVRPQDGSAAAGAGSLDLDRLGRALSQLVAGLQALHAADRLHRDIKPSNVMVDREGRVVILDFGLVQDRASARATPLASGTPAYMSPEQAEGGEAAESSDWYSVGVVLYQALTGRLPFRGPEEELQQQRRQGPRETVLQLAPGVPAELAQLCGELLYWRASARPGGAEIQRHLGASSHRGAVLSWHASDQPSFMGRDAELALLGDVLSEVADRATVAINVSGSSGIGKSALVSRFLSDARQQRAVVLSGRCYERESVPYKALDSLVDGLAQLWASLPTEVASELVPPHIGELEQSFPVLAKVKAVRKAPRRDGRAASPRERRHYAASALRAILGSIADDRPLILHIDDLQWGDSDSTAFLAEVLRSPAPAGVLLLLCSRDPKSAGELLSSLGPELVVRDLPLSPLPAVVSARLAQSLLPAQHRSSAGAADVIARESGGSPFFIIELARHLGATANPSPSLARVVQAHIDGLPQDASRVLELIAVAGRPTAQGVIAQAAGLDNARSSLDVLRAERLVSSVGLARADRVETFHDRIRETVLQGLGSAGLRERHLSLAESLEAHAEGDVERLAEHFAKGGRPQVALGYTLQAADRAMGALAFASAAELYRRALGTMTPGSADRVSVMVTLGEALSSAGRGSEAAGVYLDAAALAPDGGSTELERRAAEELLCSGRVDEGLEVMAAVLARVGLRLSKSPARALASLLWCGMRLRLRGTEFQKRSEAELGATELARIDATWTVASGLAKVDMIRGAEFASRGLLLSLAAGEPYRVARTLAIYACTKAFEGRRAAEATRRLVAQSRALAERLDRPHALGLAHMAAGVSSLVLGQWGDALERCDQATAQFRAEGAGMSWELGTAWGFRATALEYMGRWGELCPRAVEQYADAMDRGDLYAAGDMAVFVAYHHISRDNPEAAHRDVERVLDVFTSRGVLIQHYLATLALTQADLYAGEIERAWRRYEERWPALHRALIFRSPLLRAEATDARGRIAIRLAAQREGREQRRLLGVAERAIVQLGREGMAWCDALAAMLRAQIALVLGHRAEAERGFAGVSEVFSEAGMGLHAAVASRRHGELLGGTKGAQLLARADAVMRAEGISKPEKVAQIQGGPGLDPSV